MRGDSLRDLYAKTLALLGLGVLAGAGALVDYWPVGLRLMPAAPALELPGVSMVAAIPQALPPVAAADAVPASRPATRIVPQPATIEPLLLQTSDELPASLGQTVMLEPVTAPASVPEIVPANLPAAALSFDVPSGGVDETLQTEAPSDALAAMSEWREPVTLADAGDSEIDDGFLAGALRKTRSSLVRTGALTGASIVDAVRVVGGAVRRALPN